MTQTFPSIGLLLLAAGLTLSVHAEKAPAAKTNLAPLASHAVVAASPDKGPIPLPKAALGAPPAELPADAAYHGADLVVDYTSNWQGYLEPCG